MTITRDVITDLLPVYFSGEASEDTKQVVERFFTQDPSFAKLATMQVDEPLPIPDLFEDQAESAVALETVKRIKRILNFRSIIFGLAMYCTFFPLMFQFSSERGIYWFMLRDQPLLAGALWVSAVICWGTYAWSFLTLRKS